MNFYFNKIIPDKLERKMENSRICDISNIDIHRASFARHLRSKKLLENKKKGNDYTTLVFKESIENETKKYLILNN